LNIKADEAAKNTLDICQPGSTHFCIPYSAWICYSGQTRVVKHFASKVCTYLSSPAIKQFWKNKQQTSGAMWTSINWKALDHTYTESSTAQ